MKDRRMFQGWCHFLLPGSTPLTFPWKPVCLTEPSHREGTLTEPSPLPHCPVRRLTFLMRRVRASAHHRMKAAPLCLEDESAGSGSFCKGRKSHCVGLMGLGLAVVFDRSWLSRMKWAWSITL